MGHYRVLILLSLWNLTIFQGSILAAIFCCKEQGESLILLEEGDSIFHCGCCPDKELSFLWLGSLRSTSFLRKAYNNFIFWCGGVVILWKRLFGEHVANFICYAFAVFLRCSNDFKDVYFIGH